VRAADYMRFLQRFFTKGDVAILLMGHPEDTIAVGATYTGDDSRDGIADHRGHYLSLFGNDLHPGETWRTRIRMVVDAFGGDPQKHRVFLEAIRTQSMEPVRSTWDDAMKSFPIGTEIERMLFGTTPESD
jgi:hypothetical protein